MATGLCAAPTGNPETALSAVPTPDGVSLSWATEEPYGSAFYFLGDVNFDPRDSAESEQWGEPGRMQWVYQLLLHPDPDLQTPTPREPDLPPTPDTQQSQSLTSGHQTPDLP